MFWEVRQTHKNGKRVRESVQDSEAGNTTVSSQSESLCRVRSRLPMVAVVVVVINSGGGSISMSDCFVRQVALWGSSRSQKMETSRGYTGHHLEETQDSMQECQNKQQPYICSKSLDTLRSLSFPCMLLRTITASG